MSVFINACVQSSLCVSCNGNLNLGVNIESTMINQLLIFFFRNFFTFKYSSTISKLSTYWNFSIRFIDLFIKLRIIQNNTIIFLLASNELPVHWITISLLIVLHSFYKFLIMSDQRKYIIWSHAMVLFFSLVCF